MVRVRDADRLAAETFGDRDLVIVPESQGSKLDPSNRDGVGAKMGLDATKPLAAAEMTFKRIHVPGEEAIDVFLEYAARKPTALSVIGMQQLHGAAGRVDTARTAFPHRFDQPGTYKYRCTLHPNMTGVIEVTG